MEKKHESSKKVAVVGAGYWGKNLVRNFAQLGALHAICDQNEALLSGFKETYPAARLHLSFSEVLAHPEVDGVVIAVPAELHYNHAREALLAGKDVYVEKPLSLDVGHGQELVRIARERGRILMVGHLLQYHPVVLKLRDMVARGEMGKLQYIYSNRLNLGRIRREENILWSFAPHDISVILALTGEFPEEVACRGGNYLHHQIADVTISALSFPSGIRAHIFVSWLHPYKEQKLIVVGEKAMAVFDDVEPKDKLRLYPHSIEWRGNVPVPNRADAVVIPCPAEEPLRAECQHFLDALATRSTPRTDGEEGLRVLRVLAACQQALEGSGVVNLSASSAAKLGPDYFVHPTSTVDAPCQIGAGTKIWHYSHIMKDSVVGENCNLGQNVVVSPQVRLGRNVKVQNNVSIYTGVVCEDDVFLGPSMVFTNVINPRSHIVRRDEYQQTLVRRGATIGANATIVCGITLGEYAFIGAGAVVTRDVPPYALVYGNPARQKGWVCKCGVKIELPDGGFQATCAACGDRYELRDKQLFRV
ncbi:MAG: Gfo/Idh/MocA family oxidoreductase [Planctomycetes bacterium]|nr:Gfo/Idh/MocA family oxidoreductase [Planctomycetota bacterium]